MSGKRTMAVVLISALGIFVLFRAFPDPSGNVTVGSPFVAQMRNPQWIKYVRLKKTEQVRGKFEVQHYSAVVQEGGFYFERTDFPKVTNMAPDLIGRFIARGAGGISKKHFWLAYWGGNVFGAERYLTLDPRNPFHGGRAATSVDG